MMDQLQISCQEARDMMDKQQTTVIDIRDQDSYEQGHISGAKAINDGNIQEFIKEADKKKPVICYCYHGISSQSAAKYFIQQGFHKVYSLEGGYENWRCFVDSTKSEK